MKMEVSTMTSKGQITIPVAVRKKLDLQQGDKVLFGQLGGCYGTQTEV